MATGSDASANGSAGGSGAAFGVAAEAVSRTTDAAFGAVAEAAVEAIDERGPEAASEASEERDSGASLGGSAFRKSSALRRSRSAAAREGGPRAASYPPVKPSFGRESSRSSSAASWAVLIGADSSSIRAGGPSA